MTEETPESGLTTPACTVTGPAYSPGYKRLLVTLLLLLTAWGIRLALQEQTWQLNRDLILWALSGYALLLYMGATLLRSTTSVSSGALEQTWFWGKRVSRDQISYARFMRWPGLEWLVAPRLHVRTGMGPMVTFHGATPELWAAFESIAEPFRR